MIKKLAGFAGALLVMGIPGSAAVVTPLCTNTTLSAYIALGSTGCVIDDKVFSNFGYTPTDTVPTASQVNVTVDSTPFNPGLNFGALWGVSGANQSVDFHLSFTVTVLPGGHPIDDAFLGMSTGAVSGGEIDITETLCLGGTFSNPGAGTGCSTSTAGLFTTTLGAPPKLSDHVTFPNGATYTSLQVFKDIGLKTGAGTNSFANLSSITQNFSEVVPEPMTLSLMGVGLLGLGLMRRRQVKK